ncbi:MAG: hypothetical protein CNE99_04930 [OM182 bacterium MED-G24]|uniref:Uncharacterized protein n=1 Tax=OM182 bacterium MED-G24 TaxID=1986255 RepID=A0A2A5WU58_9GAMM|nr:MAG: hypothetical protein CNE99_04930 [OM182 bacterium MED-G24]
MQEGHGTFSTRVAQESDASTTEDDILSSCQGKVASFKLRRCDHVYQPSFRWFWMSCRLDPSAN